MATPEAHPAASPAASPASTPAVGSPVAEAVALFRALTGATPEGVWSAPGRVNLIGEHTDYNEGFVLPFAIPHRTTAAVRERADGRLRVASTLAPEPVEVALQDLDTLFPHDAHDAGSATSAEPATSAAPSAAATPSAPSASAPSVPEWAAYPLGVAWALRQTVAPEARDALPGLDIAIASSVPVGAGLSSSAAIEGAVATALNDLWRLGQDPVALARAGRRAENEAVGAPTGIMDQMATMLGRPDAATFLDCRTLQTRSVPLGFAAAGLRLLVIDTLVTHAHSTGGYRDRRAACERGAAALGVPALRDLTPADLPHAAEILDDVTFRRVRHVVTEDQRVLDAVDVLDARDPHALGPLLTASHASMRDDFEISVPELDTAVGAATAAGALGARMTGGGFGGAVIALVEDGRADAVDAAVRTAFASAGFREPHVFPVWPSAGPARDETGERDGS
ncbi:MULTISPECIES: galactokinase [Bacteria]|uniref:galactokinase n=1 Tax=Bacteria TaxID=2 RepID=UPI003C79A29D